MEQSEGMEPADAVFQYLIDSGAIELRGMSPSGEPTFRVTEKCREIFPEFYEEHQKQVKQTLYGLWEMGLVEITFAEGDGLDDKVSFTENNYEKLKEVYETLTMEQVEYLQMLGVPIEYQSTEETF